MKKLRIAPMLLLVTALIGLVLWQHMRLRSMGLESVALREQLAQALVRPDTQANSGPMLGGTADQPSQDSSSAELLKLRGEVTRLRRQLAELPKSASSAQYNPQAKEMKAAAVEAELKAREAQADEAKQKLAELMRVLKLASDVSETDAEAALSAPDLQSYKTVRREAEEAERFAQVFRLKLTSAQAELGGAGQTGPAQ